MEQWLKNLDQGTVVIVPTHGLANNLNERIAASKLAEGVSAWEAPNIVLWSDFVKTLWQTNRDLFTLSGTANSLISQQQSLLLWTQVVASSRREEQSLTLLNVQQTAKALQRSWRLIHDWQIDLGAVADDHSADTRQFLEWVDRYRALLKERGFVDEQMLAVQLLSVELTLPFTQVIWYAYDLITATQESFIQAAQAGEIKVDFKNAQINSDSGADTQTASYHCYVNQQQELVETLKAARRIIEQDANATINIVIPDLQHRQARVQALAREIFYPDKSPQQLQQENRVYRFSLGEPLKQWPALETALVVIGLLKNRVKVSDLSFILQNRFLRHCQNHAEEGRVFDKWLKKQRLNTLNVDQLANAYQQCLLDHHQGGKVVEQNGFLEFLQNIQQHLEGFINLLAEVKSDSGYAVLPFSDWAQKITEWLNSWGWNTSISQGAMNSVQFQLAQRWQNLLKEYSELTVVQKQAGLNRALEILQQMAHDTVFLPKAPASPILISGVYEAIGRPVKACFLLGMDDQYPQPGQADSFIPNRILQQAAYPDATSQGSFAQSRKMIENLLGAAQQITVSYAAHNQQDREILHTVSALFRQHGFVRQAWEATAITTVQLEHYQDGQAPAWPSGQVVQGGAAIFENQSNCAFKAFVTHQLKFSREQESEFGLDALDRGNIVHILLDRLWARLQTQAQLKLLNPSERASLVEGIVDVVLNDSSLFWNEVKQTLLKLEKPRLVALLIDWLDVEAARPSDFSVVEREAQGSAVFAGIAFHYIIDRLDITADGRSVIVDYKTGVVAKADWLGERIRRPQLPLYALALDEKKRASVSGIAFANVKQHESKYVSLTEAGIFRNGRWADNEEKEWRENRSKWPALFSQLAVDFLVGDARVNPIDEKTCLYCELQPVCRVSQLRKQTDAENPSGQPL